MKLEKQEERFKKLFYYPRSFNQFLFPHPHTLSPYPAARTRLRPHSLPPIPHSGSLESRVREGEVEPPLGGIRQHRQPPQSLEKFCNPTPKDNLFDLTIFFNCSGKCFLASLAALGLPWLINQSLFHSLLWIQSLPEQTRTSQN